MNDLEKIKEFCKNEKSKNLGCSLLCPLYVVCYYCDFDFDSFCPHTAELCVDIIDRKLNIKENK